MGLVFLLVIGCSAGDEAEMPKHIKALNNLTVYSEDAEPSGTVKLVREVSYGSSDSVLIGELDDVAVDESGNVYIADSRQNAIHTFKPEGPI